MNKIKLFIILSIIFLILIGIVSYFLLFKKQAKPPGVPPSPLPVGKLVSVDFLPRRILFPTLIDKKIIYQDAQSGNLNQIDLTNKKISILMEGEKIPPLERLSLSPMSTKALLLGYQTSGLVQYSLLDLKTQNITLLNQSIKTAVFVSEEKIVYQYLDKEKGINNLSIADPDGKNWKKIIDLKEETIFLNTLGTGEIVYTSSETTERFNVIKTDGSGKRTIKLPIPVNINKIAWSSDGKSIIAAVREENKTTDTFYKINIETGQKQEIKYQSQTPINAINLMLTKDAKTLYFTSDDYLYKLEF